MQPIRGQIVRVYCPSVTQFAFDEHDHNNIMYIIPRNDLVVLGGTAQEGNWDTGICSRTADAIIQRCGKIFPELLTAPVVSHWAGLRPGRSAIRVELAEAGPASVTTLPLIHNYGHGGSGMTTAWGCARTVAELAANTWGRRGGGGGGGGGGGSSGGGSGGAAATSKEKVTQTQVLTSKL